MDRVRRKTDRYREKDRKKKKKKEKKKGGMKELTFLMRSIPMNDFGRLGSWTGIRENPLSLLITTQGQISKAGDTHARYRTEKKQNTRVRKTRLTMEAREENMRTEQNTYI